MVLRGFEERGDDGSSGDRRYEGAGGEAQGGNAPWVWSLASIHALAQPAFAGGLCTLRERGWAQFLVAAVEITSCYSGC